MASSPTIAPFGDWKSPITISSTKETGANCIVEITSDGSLKDLLPPEYSAGNTVYEYGGSAYDVLPDGQIIFSNRSDNTVNILDSGNVSQLLEKRATLLYSNFDANTQSAWVLAIQEDHKHDTPTPP